MSRWWYCYGVSAFVVLMPTIALATGIGVLDINARVPGCGDGIIDSGEACDGSNLGGASCPVLGFGGGTLSCTAACSFATSSCTAVVQTTATASRGGGRGEPESRTVGTVVLSGRTMPGAEVQVQLDGIPQRSFSSDDRGDFQLSLSLAPGRYRVGVRAKTVDGSVTALTMIPVSVVRGLVSKYETIRLSPTVRVDTGAGAPRVSGAGVPDSRVLLELTPSGRAIPTLRLQTTTSPTGNFVFSLPPDLSPEALLEVRVRYDAQAVQAAASVPLRFVIPSPTIPPPVPPSSPPPPTTVTSLPPADIAPPINSVPPTTTTTPPPPPRLPTASSTRSCDLPGDYTGDCAVTILDVMVITARRMATPAPVVLPPLTSTEGVVSLMDYSVMAYYWTG